MSLQFLNSREPDATTVALIQDQIEYGKRNVAAANSSKFYRDRRVDDAIGATIRGCNQILGMSGNFKNGCLYREEGLAEKWQKTLGEEVVLDHAVPVTELVRQYKEDVPIELLMLSPVVRILKASNEKMTRLGYAKTGHRAGLPLFRYALANISIVTHLGTLVDPFKWSDEDHWNLIRSTPELRSILDDLEIKLP